MAINPNFNFNPISTQVKTGSYTIPAGEYAIIEAVVFGVGSFIIGGTAALKNTDTGFSVKGTALASDGGSPSFGTTIFQMPSSASGTVRIVSANSSASVHLDHGGLGGNGSNYEDLVPTYTSGIKDIYDNIIMGSNDTIKANGGTVDIYISGLYNGANMGLTGTFYVTAGTVLSVSGDSRYAVARYKAPD